MIDPQRLASRLVSLLGIAVEGSDTYPTEVPSIRFVGLPPPNGFRIAVYSRWRSVEAVVIPDPFAVALMKTLCSDDAQRRKEFAALANAFSAKGIKCSAKVDDQPIELSGLPNGTWMKFELSCLRLTDMVDEMSDATEVAGACIALVLSLLPVDLDATEVDPLAQGLPEGAITQITVNRYERNPANRAAAIALHGSTCQVCGFDFGKFYGSLGEGFIEIHHRTPVSQLGPEYVISPAVDLVPVCANCHRMVHREFPPIPIEELRDRLRTLITSH